MHQWTAREQCTEVRRETGSPPDWLRTLPLRIALVVAAVVMSGTVLWFRQEPDSLLGADSYWAALVVVVLWGFPSLLCLLLVPRTRGVILGGGRTRERGADMARMGRRYRLALDRVRRRGDYWMVHHTDSGYRDPTNSSPFHDARVAVRIVTS